MAQAQKVAPEKAKATRLAGGKRLVQRVEGYRHIVKRGVPTFENGEHTGALPGRLVRGGRI